MSDFQEKFRKSPRGLLYISPAGSGKTKSAIEATRGGQTTVIGPASLTKNFAQEEKKHFGKVTPRTVDTYANVARGSNLPGGNYMVLDESHNIRNPQTKAYSQLRGQRSKYQKALAMTATPLVNEPADIVSQINLVANQDIIPRDKKRFYKAFYNNVKVNPSLMDRIFKGVHSGSVRVLKDPRLVKRYLGGMVYSEPTGKFDKLLPKRNEEIVRVELGKKQQDIYKYIEKTLPWSLRNKVRSQLPPSKQEAAKLNAFLQGLRSVSNTATPFVKKEASTDSTKLDKITADLQDELKRKGKVLVYSNYLDAGINELKNRLTTAKVPFSGITGSTSKTERQKQVSDYVKNKTNVFLTSSAGSEGINLSGTTLVQLTEPHWNKTRLYQAASRGIRRGDDPDKTVKIKTYVSTLPPTPHPLRFLGFKPSKPRGSADEYLLMMSKQKEQEANSFLTALQ